MGGRSSQEDSLPQDIDDPAVMQRIAKSWEKIAESKHSRPDAFTSEEHQVKIAALLAMVFSSQETNKARKQRTKLKVLEVFSGNGASSRECEASLEKQLSEWKRTDAIFGECKMHALEAVTQFGAEANILLMFRPPPASRAFYEAETRAGREKMGDEGYGDYYACRAFIAHARSHPELDKWIVFYGELGASDGSVGMYKYLLEHPHLVLQYRQEISVERDPLGEPFRRELFIFCVVSKKLATTK